MLPLWYVVFPSPAVPQYNWPSLAGVRKYTDDEIILLLWIALIWENNNQ